MAVKSNIKVKSRIVYILAQFYVLAHSQAPMHSTRKFALLLMKQFKFGSPAFLLGTQMSHSLSSFTTDTPLTFLEN